MVKLWLFGVIVKIVVEKFDLGVVCMCKKKKVMWKLRKIEWRWLWRKRRRGGKNWGRRLMVEVLIWWGNVDVVRLVVVLVRFLVLFGSSNIRG